MNIMNALQTINNNSSMDISGIDTPIPLTRQSAIAGYLANMNIQNEVVYNTPVPNRNNTESNTSDVPNDFIIRAPQKKRKRSEYDFDISSNAKRRLVFQQ